MNIKSLLLGSAAVLVAASTAQAADAIVVEPEPVEYVRICEAYGSGFFYIPGTETCLKLGGNIRMTYRHLDRQRGGVDDPFDVDPTTTFTSATWNYRGRFNFDARNETDWGTLRSYLQLQGTGGGVGIQTLEISVAGFRLGHGDGYWATAHGYSNGPAIDSGYYGFVANSYFDYTWAADGFSLTVGVSDDAGADDTPDYYIGGKYAGSWGNVAATYVYDQDAVLRGGAAGMGAGAWKVTGKLANVGDTGWNITGLYAGDDDAATGYLDNGVGTRSATRALIKAETDSIWRVGIDGPLADDLTGYVYYSAADSDDLTTKAVGAGFNEADQWGLGVVWKPISGLAIQAEYMSGEADFGTAGDITADEDWDRFSVRITRSW